MTEEKLRVELRKYLTDHPNNFSAAAKHFSISREKVVRLVESENLSEIEHEYLDNLEEQLILFVTGRIETLTIKFNEALKLLAIKRPGTWGAKTSKLDKRPKLSMGMANRILGTVNARNTTPSDSGSNG